jgi:fibronectin-binding autotransporter adhesin
MRAVSAGFALVLLAAFGTANAHTVSIGYANAGPGSVTFSYGSYHAYDVTELTEGTMTLVGINGNSFPSTTVPFTLSSATKPVGLVDGTNNFYASGASGVGVQSPLTPTCTLGSNVCPGTVATPGSWQGVTFNGLQAGQYRFTYNPIVNPSAHWDSWNDTVRTSTVALSSGIIGGTAGIPTLDPAMLALMALFVAGFGAVVLRRMS